MLRKVRIFLASVFFIGTTLLFLDFTGTLHAWLGWMAKIQFLPAMLAVNTIVIAALLLLTVLFGRIYCSVICPLGIMQDIISWINSKRSKKSRYRFSFKKEKKWVRLGFLAFFVVTLALGIHSLAAVIAPYSAYGRIASNLLAPIYKLGNNLLAWLAERADSYAFYGTDVWIKSIPTFIIAAVSFIVIFVMAWKGGRSYCNSVCPVGTILGFFARRSIFVPVIDTEKCRNCGLCGRQCKSSCIDMKNHVIDYSRCVACMDCLENCKEGAISYKSRYSQSTTSDTGRRAFLVSAAMASAAAGAEAARKRHLPTGKKEDPQRECRPVPAGAMSQKNFHDRCTACQLCVSACPNGVLRPSSSLITLMQPEMHFDKDYCRPECTICSSVCPAGAIKPVSQEERTAIQIGVAVVDHELCVVNTDNVQCGNCARHCPAGAIRLVRKNPDNEESLLIPAVDEERCIGCGACEHLCPVRPVPAIHVEGTQVHRTI